MRIAIVRLSALGDIFQTMVILQFIKKKYTNSTIDWFVDSRFADALDNECFIDNIYSLDIKNTSGFSFPIKFFKLIIKLKKIESYDIVIDFQGLIKSAIVTSLIPGETKYGFDKDSCKERLSAVFYDYKVSVGYEVNVIERYLRLVDFSLGVEVHRDDIFNKASFFQLSDSNTNKYIIFVLGASFKSKIYPLNKFAEVAESIPERIIAIWHTSKEKEMSDELVKMNSNIESKEVRNMRELKQIVFGSKLVIGGDTGPVHLAWALNIPSITIFGCTPAYRNAYITSFNKVVESESSVNPIKINKNDFSIRDIESNKVVKIAKELLGYLN